MLLTVVRDIQLGRLALGFRLRDGGHEAHATSREASYAARLSPAHLRYHAGVLEARRLEANLGQKRTGRSRGLCC